MLAGLMYKHATVKGRSTTKVAYFPIQFEMEEETKNIRNCKYGINNTGIAID